MGKTGISWTDEVWNCVRGCTRVSPGCERCYAEVQAARIVRMAKGKPTKYDGLVKITKGGEPRWTGVVRLDPGDLAWPLRKKKPMRIFVNSMSDLFHGEIEDEQIAAVFAVMAACPQHTFQVLTKRSERMREWFRWFEAEVAFETCENDKQYESLRRVLSGYAQGELGDGSSEDEDRQFWRMMDATDHKHLDWPLRNVWLGVSVEDQERASRIVDLLETPAAVRFISAEPLLGPLDLGAASPNARPLVEDLDWVIAGCESGDGARPCDVEWLRSLRDQTAAARVPFFLKQARCDNRPAQPDNQPHVAIGAGYGATVTRGVIELPYLDGVQHAALPNVHDGRRGGHGVIMVEEHT